MACLEQRVRMMENMEDEESKQTMREVRLCQGWVCVHTGVGFGHVLWRWSVTIAVGSAGDFQGARHTLPCSWLPKHIAGVDYSTILAPMVHSITEYMPCTALYCTSGIVSTITYHVSCTIIYVPRIL